MGSLNALAGSVVYLDANVFIYAVEGFRGTETKLRSLFDRLDRGELLGVTSELTLAEALVKPLRDGNTVACDNYRRMLQTSAALRVLPVTRGTLIEAAGLRATSALKLPDAIHAATAVAAGCTSFLTNDSRFEAISSLNVLLVSNLP